MRCSVSEIADAVPGVQAYVLYDANGAAGSESVVTCCAYTTPAVSTDSASAMIIWRFIQSSSVATVQVAFRSTCSPCCPGEGSVAKNRAEPGSRGRRPAGDTHSP